MSYGRSRNHCANNNAGENIMIYYTRSNIITIFMYANGYMDDERKEFPYWEFMKNSKKNGTKTISIKLIINIFDYYYY